MSFLSPLQFVREVKGLVVRHRRVHLLLVFLPLLLTSLAAGFFAPSFLLVPSLPFSPFFLLTALFGLSLAFAISFVPRSVGKLELVARLIDERVQGKERFLTLVTLPDSQTGSPLHPLLEQDAAHKASALVPAHDLPFVLDKRKVMASLVGSALLLTLAFFAPALVPYSLRSQFQGEEETDAFAAAAEKLEQTASLLLQQHRGEVGEQLLRLAQDLQNPNLSPQEKLQRLAKARQQLDLPLPNLLPLDLHLFSKQQETKGEGQGEKPPDQGQSQADKGEDSGGQSQQLASAAGKQGQNQNGKEKERQLPSQQQGGGIQFDFPQEEGDQEKPDRGATKPGEGPADAQVQAQDATGPGQDPNRPGDGPNQEQLMGSHLSEASGSRLVPQLAGVGKTGGIGQGPGERYYQPGEQPVGFLTKDARFVKVRVPRGVEPQGESGRRVPNAQKTAPLIPYSNAPLPSAGPAGEAHIEQPTPLEYRVILQK